MDPSQNRRTRYGNRVEDLPQQELKHKGVFHLVNPNNLDPFDNISDTNPDFVC
jgi:hypothetical protein